MIDLLEINDFLDAAERRQILTEMRASGELAATVYGKETTGSVEALTRKVSRVVVPAETSDFIREKLLENKEKLENHFQVSLTECEEPQFLRYRTGDFFVAHQDGNTPLIFDDSRFRKISVIVFLNSQSKSSSPETFQGGELVFHGGFPDYDFRQIAQPQAGKLIAFRAETTHEVAPVTDGERFTIVSWFR